jgi:predicted PurR-regulated permease PerM
MEMAMRDHPARLGDRYAPLGTMRLIEQSIVLLLVVTVIVGVLTVLWPFTTAILFGSTLAIAAWPLRQAMVSLGFGRGLAATLLLLLSLVLIGLAMLVMAPILTDH